MAGVMKPETLKLRDGTSMEVMRNEGMTEGQWMDYKYYMEANPEEAKDLESYSTNPDLLRRQMLLQALSDQWQKQINSGDDEFSKKIKTLEEDPDFEQMFLDVKNYAGEQVAEYYQDDGVMMKISRKMGGVPREVKPTLEKIRKTPITLQEAVKFGDIKQLQKYISETESHKELREIDAKDHKGITMLGYAIGANRTKIVELLLANGADPNAVDDKGNNGIHYAAAYGRKDLLELMMTKGVKVDEPNNDGKTPLALAKQNKMTVTKELLLKSGATALPDTPPPETADDARDGE
mmetsp:Transcript_20318/g.45845  ORF Transcript_20318/g.45845 Transcript_20318/m.45845 type:complete len:293 (+) Transcript_20318:68-946(+)